MHAEYAIIGGTGVYDPAMLQDAERHTIETPYGTAEVTLGTYAGKRVAFMPRHGYKHSVAPHKINYRANIRALKQLGVHTVLATAAVGSLKKELAPGDLVLVNDFLDMTKSRPQTFYEGAPEGVVHIDMTDAYCGRIRQHLAAVAGSQNIAVKQDGVYVTTEGPRFETPAEIRLYAAWGGDVVGMTSVPEVILAKESEMCYATVAMVTNYCTGISSHPLTHQEVVDTMKENVQKIRELFFHAIESDKGERTCACPHALAELGSL
ncbi:5'-methylthioadenosine phosphorylase [Tumebacillus sp. BK434]|uniref:S-methyl-5'-thioadenosine phosphorylase n=1 Tax=Tumebacillus sp. BK434 TaxID=2512169 RepID=UPI001052CDA5|nr:S-methyl-5'-thioadenosine phosphorylase [Tumebacillus sp. BK434]TCP59277.1 5'-methylthioadenosine phosphorylase [Tumebacillus sp. BK434]